MGTVSSIKYIFSYYTFADKKLTTYGARPLAVRDKVLPVYYLLSRDLSDAASDLQVLIHFNPVTGYLSSLSVVSPKKMVISLFEKELGTVTMYIIIL